MMNQYWKVLKTEADYKTALERLDEIADAELNTAEGDELELLSVLIKHYEDEVYPFKLPDPLEMIKLRMEEMGLKNKDLVDIIGSESHVSSVLSGKRQITLEMARKLSKRLNIRASIFINDDVPFETYDIESIYNKSENCDYPENRKISLPAQCKHYPRSSKLNSLLENFVRYPYSKYKTDLLKTNSPLFISYAHDRHQEHIYVLVDLVMFSMDKKNIEAEDLSEFFVRLDNEKVK